MKKIKRFFAALLITVMSLTTLVFASESEKIEYTDEAYATYSKTIFENAFIGITYDECKFSVENSIGYSKEAYESYLPFTEDDKLGIFVKFSDSTITRHEDGSTVECVVVAEFENGRVAGTFVYKTFGIGNPTPISVTFASADADTKSFGDKMIDAGLNTLIGMFTVVVVLALISCIISMFKYISVIQKKLENKGKDTDTETAVDKTIAQIEEKEELVDDLELVAVITAAIAASTGTSADGFVVRSIKKAKKRRR